MDNGLMPAADTWSRREKLCMSLIPIIIFSLFISSIAFAEETPLYELNLTKGILALDQKEYSRAAEYFNTALKEKPDDHSATLYLGVALYHTGNEKEAERLLKKALEADPLSSRANFALGVLFYTRGLDDEARDFFEVAKTYAQDTEITDMAGYYIGEMERKTVAAKNWEIQVSAGMQYDTNVIVEPDDVTLPESISRKSDWRGFLYLQGKYSPVRTETLDIGLTYAFYQSIHRELYDFNVHQHLPGVVFSYGISEHVSARFQYTFEYTNVGSEDYLFSHTLGPSVLVAEGRGFFTMLQYAFQTKDFKDTPLFLTNSERDGSNNLIGVTQYIPISSIGTIFLNYTYDHDSADNDYWSYDGNAGELGCSLHFGRGWLLDLSGQYYHKRYRDDYPGADEERKDRMRTFTTTLSKAIDPKFDISAGWLYEKNSSNLDEFDYTREIMTIMLRVHL
jgi:hypothetical protein